MTSATTSPVLTFIRARLADDKRHAGNARDSTGTGDWADEGYEVIDGHPTNAVCESRGVSDPSGHIAQQDPARVLRQVVALEAILMEHEHAADEDGNEWCGGICYREDRPYEDWRWPCPTLRAIASIWSDHPDYDPPGLA